MCFLDKIDGGVKMKKFKSIRLGNGAILGVEFTKEKYLIDIRKDNKFIGYIFPHSLRVEFITESDNQTIITYFVKEV